MPFKLPLKCCKSAPETDSPLDTPRDDVLYPSGRGGDPNVHVIWSSDSDTTLTTDYDPGYNKCSKSDEVSTITQESIKPLLSDEEILAKNITLEIIEQAKKEISEEQVMYYCDTWSSQTIDVSELTEITDFSIKSEIFDVTPCQSSRLHSTRSHKSGKMTQWWSFPWLNSHWTSTKGDDTSSFDNILNAENEDNISFEGTPV